MNWLGGWEEIDDPDVAAGLETELARELGKDHRLYGIPVAAIGRMSGSDDVLFRLLDNSERVAVVHLTWIQSPPDRPPWPHTTIYSSMDAWVEEIVRLSKEENK